MTGCEMCGRESELSQALIEGVELMVCGICISYGKAIKKPAPVIPKKPLLPMEPQVEIIECVREEYPKLIREKREKLGLKQEEFAKFLSERLSLIHKIESGQYIPPITMARKIERQLCISLIETKQVEPQHAKAKHATFTIGDVVRVK